MSAHRPSPTDVAVPLLAAAASFFTLLSWAGLSEDASAFLVPLYWMALGVAVLGVALRSVGVPRLLVPSLQALAVVVVLLREFSGSWVPGPASVEAARETLRLSVESTAQYGAPVPASVTALPPVLILIGSVVVLCVDALAATLRRAPLTGLPLLAVMTVPMSLLDGVPWLTFSLAAGAFVMLLAAEHAARLGAWGQNLAGSSGAVFRDTQPRQVRLGTLWPSASRLGLGGVGIALLVPLLLPVGTGLLDGGNGPGVGFGGDEVDLDNPFVDIRRDLVRGDDVDLVEVVTDDPDPSYLRLTVLDEYDGTRWRPSEREIPEANRAEGALPAPPGLDGGTPREEHRWELRLTDDFTTTWLPAPYPVTSVEAPGDWRFDTDTLDFVLADEDDEASGIEYRATGLDLRPDPRALVSTSIAPQGLLFDNVKVPDDLPPLVGELADQVTEGATSDFERAVRLQRWFREEGGFRYSLEPDAGNGADDLERFLTPGIDGRVGYCEQFAATMALMARTQGMPARVAVGFLQPEPTGRENSYVFSAHDLHAWPEVYFEGAGWVRFEPTPQVRATEPPPYTAGAVPEAPTIETPSATPSAEAPSTRPEGQEEAAETAETTSADGAPAWLGWAGAALLVAALLAAPRAVRVALRRGRLGRPVAGEAVEGAWAEVRATAVDLGLRWDDGATLRTRARRLAPSLSPDAPEALPALERLVLLLERARYSRLGLTEGDQESASPASLARTVTAAMRAAAGSGARRRADWAPRSLWRRPGPGGRSPGARAETRAGTEAERVSV